MSLFFFLLVYLSRKDPQIFFDFLVHHRRLCFFGAGKHISSPDNAPPPSLFLGPSPTRTVFSLSGVSLRAPPGSHPPIVDIFPAEPSGRLLRPPHSRPLFLPQRLDSLPSFAETQPAPSTPFLSRHNIGSPYRVSIHPKPPLYPPCGIFVQESLTVGLILSQSFLSIANLFWTPVYPFFFFSRTERCLSMGDCTLF